jgi:NAD+ kinase
MRIGIIANRKRPRADQIVREVLDWIVAHRQEYYVCDQLADLALDPDRVIARKDLCNRCDLIISMGGDGTLLATARDVGDKEVPILGVNLGSLGFLTQIAAHDVSEYLQQIVDNRHEVESRMMLRAALKNSDETQVHNALNDVVVDRGSVARLIQLDLYVNGEYISTYRADGLIICTPTGSTAYNSAVGGPILNPRMEAIIASPMAPQSLAARPLLFDGDDIINIKIASKEHNALITIDGQISAPLDDQLEVEIRKSDFVTKLVTFPHNSFYKILRTKLHWAVLPRTESD